MKNTKNPNTDFFTFPPMSAFALVSYSNGFKIDEVEWICQLETVKCAVPGLSRNRTYGFCMRTCGSGCRFEWRPASTGLPGLPFPCLLLSPFQGLYSPQQ